jgi:hypothetical protein
MIISRNLSGSRHMPPKLEEETSRINLVAPASWLRRIDEWRRNQPDLPTRSEAIRRASDIGMEASAKKGGKPSKR